MVHSGLLLVTQTYGILGMTFALTPTTPNLDLPYTAIVLNIKGWRLHREETLNADSCWFTYGSKTPSDLRAGVYCRGPRVEVSTCLDSYATVFQSEIYVIVLCEEIGRTNDPCT